MGVPFLAAAFNAQQPSPNAPHARPKRTTRPTKRTTRPTKRTTRRAERATRPGAGGGASQDDPPGCWANAREGLWRVRPRSTGRQCDRPSGYPQRVRTVPRPHPWQVSRLDLWPLPVKIEPEVFCPGHPIRQRMSVSDDVSVAFLDYRRVNHDRVDIREVCQQYSSRVRTHGRDPVIQTMTLFTVILAPRQTKAAPHGPVQRG